MVKLYKIKFLKDTELKKVGEIGEATKKNAEQFVNHGYAEYIEKPKGKKLLTDKQIEKKLTEIAKLEMPLEVNKELRKLKDKSAYSLQVLQKQLKIYADRYRNTSVVSVVSVVSDTSVVSDKKNKEENNFLHFLLVSSHFNKCFSETLGDRVLKHFFTTNNTPITVDKLAKILGEKKGSVRAAINRKKEFFSDSGVQGKAGVIQVIQVGVEEIKQRIAKFEEQEERKKQEIDEIKQKKESEEKYYSDILSFTQNIKLKREGGIILLDFNELVSYNPEIADYFIDDPTKFISCFSKIYDNEFEIQVLNLPKSNVINIEEIRKDHINKIISIEGRVTSFGEVKPIITNLNFECPSCGNIISILQDYRIGILKEPKRCSCGRRGGFKVDSRSEVNACFIQLADLQDNTDNPHSQRVKAVVFNRMTEPINIKMFTPGNEVRCIGILKGVPIFKGGNQTVFINWILEIMGAEMIEKDVEVNKLSEEDKSLIDDISNKINSEGLDAIIPSFAPDVYGYDFIKSAMILQLCNKRNDKKKKSVRNKSNILLIGDPGVAKSVLGDFALSITPGSMKAVGGGSSAVGITASVMKEEDTLGGYRVEPGAMILAKDLLFLDELNNLSDEDKPKLQEGMSEQTVSINKANIHVQMKVSAGILAVANPKNGHFEEGGKESITEQFNIPSPILNRFDSVFVFRDYVDEEKDSKIAERMIKRHRGNLNPTYDKSILSNFFAYIKSLPEPEINDDIEKYIQKVYSLARKTYNIGVKINPRFLESLTRMAIASAKIRQSEIIEKKDINLALGILSQSQYNISEIDILNELSNLR